MLGCDVLFHSLASLVLALRDHCSNLMAVRGMQTFCVMGCAVQTMWDVGCGMWDVVCSSFKTGTKFCFTLFFYFHFVANEI